MKEKELLIVIFKIFSCTCIVTNNNKSYLHLHQYKLIIMLKKGRELRFNATVTSDRFAEDVK